MADVDGRLTAEFSRHLVTLEVSYTVRHQKKPPEDVHTYFTGFLLWEDLSEIEGVTIWVTAGHCMRWIEDDLLGKPEDYGNVGFRFVDTLHNATVSDLPVPFDYAAAKNKGWLVNTGGGAVELGLDFGVIFLLPHYSRPILRNGIRPVSEANWKCVPDSFDKYFVLGLPAERVGRDEHGRRTAMPAMVRIARLDERPECFSEQTDAMFYGVVDPESRVRNIEGMSGGPIIGMTLGEDGVGRYWFIAVQSSWYAKERIVCASPLAKVREVLTQALNVLFARPANSGGG